MPNEDYILAGDVGGTNTRLQLFRVNRHAEHVQGSRAPGELVYERKYQNTAHRSLLDVVQLFLRDSGVSTPPTTGCFAVAGPVADNQVVFTNRSDWNANGDALAAALSCEKVLIINDFVANGYGLLTLNESTECTVLQHAPKTAGAPIACIGPGTGLGECFLTCAPHQQYICYPTEGGHAEFAPRNDLEMELLAFLKQKFAQKHRVSVERVISGPGLASIYEFLQIRYPEQVNPIVRQAFESAGELNGAVVSQNSEKDKLCKLAMEIFTSAYGAEAGVAGLKWLPFGGLYLTGGLTPKNLHWLNKKDSLFMASFKDKGRVSGILDRVPVYAVLVEDLGLRGASLQAFQLLRSMKVQEESSRKRQTAWLSAHMVTCALLAGAAAGFIAGRLIRR